MALSNDNALVVVHCLPYHLSALDALPVSCGFHLIERALHIQFPDAAAARRYADARRSVALAGDLGGTARCLRLHCLPQRLALYLLILELY